jgi:hypothetical protein
MEAERSEARVAHNRVTVNHRISLVDQASHDGAHSTPTIQWSRTVRNSDHHGNGLTKTSIDSCDPDLRIEGAVFFGKILRMAGLACHP